MSEKEMRELINLRRKSGKIGKEEAAVMIMWLKSCNIRTLEWLIKDIGNKVDVYRRQGTEPKAELRAELAEEKIKQYMFAEYTYSKAKGRVASGT